MRRDRRSFATMLLVFVVPMVALVALVASISHSLTTRVLARAATDQVVATGFVEARDAARTASSADPVVRCRQILAGVPTRPRRWPSTEHATLVKVGSSTCSVPSGLSWPRSLSRRPTRTTLDDVDVAIAGGTVGSTSTDSIMVAVAAPRQREQQVLASSIRIAGGILAITFAVGLLGATVIARRLGRPIRRLARQARSAAARDADEPDLLHATDPGEVRDLAESFGLLLRERARRAREQQELVANMAHELRSPVGGLRMNVEVLAANRDADTRDEIQADLVVQAGELSQLVEDLLVLARDPASAGATTDVDLERLVDEAAQLAGRRFQGASIEVRSTLGEPVLEQVDEQLLRHAVQTVLTNALTHGEAPVEIVLEEHGDSIRMSVVDSGPGFSAGARAADPFERFARFPSRHQGGGSGIGLAIARKLARSRGGRAWVEHDPRGGARVTWELPRRASAT